MPKTIAEKLIFWYRARKRSLPWRDQPQAYAVWVAEIMAQQTRLDGMLPYYDRWMKRFPSLASVAEADEQELLSIWEGLGYYQRARNFQKAAQIVVRDFGGEIPRDIEALKRLPGIGPYTAGALASLAFGMDEAAVDGNASRVIARLFDIDQPVGSGAGQQKVWALAREMLPKGEAADFNQALMDLGASLCNPRNPKCESCPVRKECKAYELGNQLDRPVRRIKKDLATRHFASLIVARKGRYLILQRNDEGLLGGMWEFPNREVEKQGSAKEALEERLGEVGLKVRVGATVEEIKHSYSHFHAQVRVFECQLLGGKVDVQKESVFRWVRAKELSAFPMGKIDRRIANRIRSDVG